MSNQYRVYQGGILKRGPVYSPPGDEENVILTETAEDSIKNIKKRNTFYQSIVKFTKKSFLPQGYPNSVHPYFVGYTGWYFLLNIVGNIILVLTTQAMLISMGKNSKSNLSSAVALQWIIKDVVGQFGSILTAGILGTKFDMEAKKLRFVAAISIYFACFLEFCTLLTPQYFLYLASSANLIKQISAIVLTATRASQLVQMSRSGNLGDLTAKIASQTNLANLIGNIIGIAISSSLNLNSFRGFIVVFMPLVAVVFLSIYQSTGYMLTNTINRERLNIILDYFWIKFSDAMATKDDPWNIICEMNCEVCDDFIIKMDKVSVEESFISPIVRWNYLPHVEINPSLTMPENYDIFVKILDQLPASENYRYLINVDHSRKKVVYLWLTEESKSADRIEAYFLCYLLEKFHFDMTKFAGLKKLFVAWKEAMERNNWNIDKFYYADMEKRLVHINHASDLSI